MDTENVMPNNAVTASTRQGTKPQHSLRPLASSKKGLSAQSSKPSQNATAPRAKRRALGDITNRHAAASSSNASKTIKKAGNGKTKHPLRPVITVHRSNRIIPTDENGSVESEFIPDCPPEPFEPPVFDFVDDIKPKDTGRHERDASFYEFDYKDSPVRNMPYPIKLRQPELSDASFKPESCLPVFVERANVNVDSLFTDDDLPALRLSR